MKRIILINIVFVFIFLMSCETKITQADTINIKHKEETQPKIIVPEGSQLFHESVKLHYLHGVDGYILTSTNIKPCKNSGSGVEDPNDDKKLNRITFAEDSFSIHFSIVENCCSEFLCEAEIIDESTLNIIYHPFGKHCSCNCKFELEYTFILDDSLEEIGQKRTAIKYIQFNNEPISKVEFKKQN